MDYVQAKKALIPELVDNLLFDNVATFSRSNVLSINHNRIDSKTFADYFLRLCKEEKFSKYFNLLQLADGPNQLLEDIKKQIKFSQASNKIVKNEDGSAAVVAFDYDGLIPIISIEDANVSVFYDKTKREILDLDLKTYETVYPKEERLPYTAAVITFNPYRPEYIYTDFFRTRPVSHFNTYKVPEWQLTRQLSEEEREEYVKLPLIIDSFMQHLFPDKEAREFVYDWLHHALVKRCETYLVLNGAKGIGKGIFTDNLCKMLLGKDNHRLAPRGAFDSNFNAMLKDCRMIIFDEFNINDHDKINTLKKYANTDQAVELKGKDVKGTIKTFNSFVISSNSVTDMKIEWDDRRFSVMDMTDTKLEVSWGAERTEELIKAIEDESHETMRQFGYWLMYRTPRENQFRAFKGDHFWKLCYSSLSEWCKVIIDEIETGSYDVIDDVTLKMKLKERGSHFVFPKRLKVEEFLKNYKHKGQYYLGEVEKTENGGFLINVSSDFYKGRDNLGIEWKNLLDEELL